MSDQSILVIIRSKVKRATGYLDDFEPLTSREIDMKFKATQKLNEAEILLDEMLADPEKFDKVKKYGRRKR